MFYDHMHEVDLILLDIMLPGMDGSEILKEIRKKSNTPVIMVTARDSIHDQLLNFANGADDYITKPYALAIVKVHIEAILKRAGKQKERVKVGHIAVEPDTWRVYVDEKAIETTPKEYELLSYLIKNKNVVMTRDSILESVWDMIQRRYAYGRYSGKTASQEDCTVWKLYTFGVWCRLYI